MSRSASVERITRETRVAVTVAMDRFDQPAVSTTLPFFDHMLTSCAFHGRFGLVVDASGDTNVDPHHVVEDVGIVLGSCLDRIVREGGAVRRFGHAVVPMDEALSEATIDVCGRPTLVYRAEFPQDHSGSFGMWLFREFFSGLSMGARAALHLECRYGENAHHMVEALFKATGKAIGEAYAPIAGSPDPGASDAPPAEEHGRQMSTKGAL